MIEPMRNRAGLSGFRASAPLLWPFIYGLRALDLDVDAFLGRVGLSFEEVQDPDTRIPVEIGVELAFMAAEDTGDAALGLHLSERYVPGVFGVLDYLAH